MNEERESRAKQKKDVNWFNVAVSVIVTILAIATFFSETIGKDMERLRGRVRNNEQDIAQIKPKLERLKEVMFRLVDTFEFRPPPSKFRQPPPRPEK